MNNTLFPLEQLYLEGFQYLPDFISEREEQTLLNFIQTLPLHAFHFQGFEAKCRVASFGLDWSFERKELSRGKAMPSQFDPVIERVGQQLSLPPGPFAELLVTAYPVGSLINWHRDAPPFDLIAGLSLAADCTFKLRQHDKAAQTRKSILSIPVKRRSLYVMQGAAREAWQHSTAPVNTVRYSITLRSL